jgi:hypothetical protein
MERFIVVAPAPFQNPYTSSWCQIATQAPAFCTYFWNREDPDLTLFLKKQIGTAAKTSGVYCYSSTKVLDFYR